MGVITMAVDHILSIQKVKPERSLHVFEKKKMFQGGGGGKGDRGLNLTKGIAWGHGRMKQKKGGRPGRTLARRSCELSLFWEGQETVAADSLLEYLRLPRIREGRLAAQQLVQEATQRPVVDGLVVPAGQHQLGREVVGGPAQCEGLGLHGVVLLERDALREPEVDHLFFVYTG